MNRNRRTIMISVVVIALTSSAVALLLLRRPSEEAGVKILNNLPVDLTVRAPKSVAAGSSFVVDIRSRSASSSGSGLRLDVLSAVTQTRLRTELVNGQASVTIPESLTRGSGRLLIEASTDLARGSVVVDVTPNGAANGIVPLAGPRSVVADGRHWTMVTVIPTDVLGNALPDGTAVRLHIRRPGGTVEILGSSLRNLVTGIRVMSGTRSGFTTIRVEVAGATGPEVQVREVAGPPVEFELTGPDEPVRADGRTLLTIITSPLSDRFGNAVEDGTVVTLQGDSPDGRISALSPTIGGVAVFHLQAPRSPGSITLSAYAGTTASRPLALTIGRESTPFGLTARRSADRVIIVVGPVLTQLGGFAPDGTEVEAMLPDGSTQSGQIAAGMCTMSVSVDRGDPIVVDVLGARQKVVAP